MLSKRVHQLGDSKIVRVFQLAEQLKDPCNLSVGQPHFDVPGPVKEAAIQAIRLGHNGYTQPHGITPLREALHQSYKNKGIPQESVMITSAVSGGFLLALLALFDVGDELVISDPYFVWWRDLALVLGVEPRIVDTYPDFRWREESLRAAITPKTKAIILSSVGNPTGVAVTEDELRLIARVAREHDLWVIYDEIYEIYSYDRPHPNMARVYPEKTLLLGGFSKSHSLTGWRVGVAAGPRSVIDAMVKLQQCSFVCPPSMAQWGALTALDVAMDDAVADYKRKRDLVVEQLQSAYEFVPADGAFYLFVKAPRGMTGDALVERALEEGLILIPGSVFSQRNSHFRLSFCNTDAALERGVEILLKLARNQGAQRCCSVPATHS